MIRVDRSATWGGGGRYNELIGSTCLYGHCRRVPLCAYHCSFSPCDVYEDKDLYYPVLLR